MKEEKHISEKIEAYLNKELEADQLIEFERLLETNPDLRQDVDIYRELNAHFTDKEALAFRENLSSLRNEITDKKTPTNPKRNIWPWIVLAGLVGSFLFLVNSNKSTETELDMKSLEPAAVDQPTENHEKIKHQNESPPAKTQNKKEEIVPVEREKIKKPKPKNPIALADFAVNPILEGLMENTYRGQKNGVLKMTKKPTSFDLDDDLPIEIILEGHTDQVIDEEVVVLLFSNDTRAYEDYQPLLTLTPTIQKEAEAYQVSLKKTISLKPGLYYYLIETTDTEELLYVGKFSVSRR